jgi:hypothetical protein
VGLQVGADIGSLPSATLGVGLQAGVRAGPALVDAQVSYWVPERALATGSSANAGGAGGRIGLYSGGLLGCLDALRTSTGLLRLGLCARGEIGAQEGNGFGVQEPSHTTAFWAAAFGGASVWLSSGSLRTALSAEVGTPLVRPDFDIEGVGEVFRARPVLVRLSSTVDWTFP